LNKAGAVASLSAANLTPRRRAFQHRGGRGAGPRNLGRRSASIAPMAADSRL